MVAMETRVLESRASNGSSAGSPRSFPTSTCSCLVEPRSSRPVQTFGDPLTYLATTLGYAVLYASVTLAIAALIFRRRDFL